MAVLTPANGNMYVTTNFQFALEESYKGCKVLIIDDVEKSFFEKYNSPNIMNASILLPPYSSMDAYEHGDDKSAQMIYYNHICTQCSKVTSAIIRALSNGLYLMLYIPEHIYSQVSFFLSYLCNQHGITTGNTNNIYGYDANYNDNNIRFMFINGHCSAEEVIMNLDLNNLYTDAELFDQLCQLIQPNIEYPTTNNIIAFFKAYQQNMLNCNNDFLPMVGLL